MYLGGLYFKFRHNRTIKNSTFQSKLTHISPPSYYRLKLLTRMELKILLLDTNILLSLWVHSCLLLVAEPTTLARPSPWKSMIVRAQNGCVSHPSRDSDTLVGFLKTISMFTVVLSKTHPMFPLNRSPESTFPSSSKPINRPQISTNSSNSTKPKLLTSPPKTHQLSLAPHK